jgi:hypothetical protein
MYCAWSATPNVGTDAQSINMHATTIRTFKNTICFITDLSSPIRGHCCFHGETTAYLQCTIVQIPSIHSYNGARLNLQQADGCPNE